MAAILEKIDPYTQPSFSLKNRLARLTWGLVYILFFRTSPRLLHKWRSFLLRCFGAKIGKDCHVYPHAKIWAPWNLVMADNAGIADDVNCYCIEVITLGKKVVVSQGIYVRELMITKIQIFNFMRNQFLLGIMLGYVLKVLFIQA